MQNTIDSIKSFMSRAGQNLPTSPTTPSEDVRLRCAKLILEEALETIRALGVDVCIDEDTTICQNHFFRISSFHDVNLVEILDGAIDSYWVTTIGTPLACGMGELIIPAMQEVSDSNHSKFIDGWSDPETGKWIKGPSYTPANLSKLFDD